MNHKSISIFLSSLCSLALFSCASEPPSPYAELIDASTPLRARNDVNIRRGDEVVGQIGSIENIKNLDLCGIKTPDPTEPGGEEARQALIKLINQNASSLLTVYWLERPDLGEAREDFAEVFIKVKREGEESIVFINQEMVRTGFATIDPETINQCSQKADILAAQ
jgi:endonuclease YncB( thermonuclease family)